MRENRLLLSYLGLVLMLSVSCGRAPENESGAGSAGIRKAVILHADLIGQPLASYLVRNSGGESSFYNGESGFKFGFATDYDPKSQVVKMTYQGISRGLLPPLLPLCSGRAVLTGNVLTLTPTSGGLCYPGTLTLAPQGDNSMGITPSLDGFPPGQKANYTRDVSVVDANLPLPYEIPNINGRWMHNGQTYVIKQINGVFTIKVGADRAQEAKFVTRKRFDTLDGLLSGELNDDTTGINFSDGRFLILQRPEIGGFFTFNNKVASVIQSGNIQDVLNENGDRRAFVFLSNKQILVEQWGNLVGNLSADNKNISWSNNSAWKLLHRSFNLFTFTADRKLAYIAQQGLNLSIVNENCGSSPGRITPAGQIVAEGWGNLYGNVKDTYGGRSISFAASVWVEPLEEIVHLGCAWKIGANGSATRLLQRGAGGTTLTFINEYGQTSEGTLVTVGSLPSGGEFIDLTATLWNLTPRMVDDRTKIDFKNNTFWSKRPIN